MTGEIMTIGEMCETYQVTPRTLRFYEAKELLMPIRDGSRRLFTRRDRARLTLILRGKRFGFSLEEIRQLLDLYDIGDQQVTQLRKTYEIALERRQEMRAQRDELTTAIADLEDQLDLVRDVLAERGVDPAVLPCAKNKHTNTTA
ncbi:DNA-binding transcriptional MerR regulator [Rubricella aquisinus]|jgi:DNA-binding transcriptional MerR regulator|uniref:DNA-binding transcriptional MerR regulator n=1 Tax=Rubricella aquisinus TaxID=2028108 RepID=A0A840X5V0_9RHOB|nr:MerR family DNA-binding transcriptional regulator [Rubricella aquisinus]MBB5516087.1 DNA-binding transcriptional MerR regulator [Rubricella aquisinus]